MFLLNYNNKGKNEAQFQYLQYKMFLLNEEIGEDTVLACINLQYKMFLLNIVRQRIANSFYIFTIQNVPIKFSNCLCLQLTKIDLQYKMFLLNCTGIFY